MIVIDTSALIAVLKREAEADIFEDVITQEDMFLISAVSLLEASIVLAGHLGDRRSWQTLDDAVMRLNLQVRAHDAELTDIAREAFLRFGKGRHPAKLNFGDCAAYALAKSEGLALLFKGDDFSQTYIAAAV